MSGTVLFQFAQDSIQNDILIESNWLPLGSKTSAFPDIKIFACPMSRRERNHLAWPLFQLPFLWAVPQGTQSSSVPQLHCLMFRVATNTMAQIAAALSSGLAVWLWLRSSWKRGPEEWLWAVFTGQVFHSCSSDVTCASARPLCVRRGHPRVPRCSRVSLTNSTSGPPCWGESAKEGQVVQRKSASATGLVVSVKSSTCDGGSFWTQFSSLKGFWDAVACWLVLCSHLQPKPQGLAPEMAPWSIA